MLHTIANKRYNGKRLYVYYIQPEPSPYPSAYQYLEFTYDDATAYDCLVSAINDRGFSAVDSGSNLMCLIPNETTSVSFGYVGEYNHFYGCKDWYLPYVTDTTALFEWSPLTSIPDNFWGLSATKNLGRAFNCLHTRNGGLTGVKSFDGLVNVETFEYAFYENKYPMTFPTAFAQNTFQKCSSFWRCFTEVTANNEMVPFAQHCNNVCPSSLSGNRKWTYLTAATDLVEFRALDWY